MNAYIAFVLSLFIAVTASADPSRQRANGQTADGLNWQVYFNFPSCDHSADGRRKGAWCEACDIGNSENMNGIEAQLLSWFNDAETNSLYISYFSQCKNVARLFARRQAPAQNSM